MFLHSTNGQSPKIALADGITNGIAPDGGLYMPDNLPRLPRAFFLNIHEMNLKEIAFVVCNTLFGSMIAAPKLKKIVDESLNFDIPLRDIGNNKFLLELYHGPTLSFKDVGARLMARILPEVLPASEQRDIIIATSGDSGEAIANAFANNKGKHVIVLYPKGKLSEAQILQFALLPGVVAVEVTGSFDDCQHIVKEALRSDAQQHTGRFTSGNSINLARELPSIIYFFHAYAQALAAHGSKAEIVMSLPCGNLGGLAAALMAKKMGLPVKRFIAANNANDVFVTYLKTGDFKARKALLTIAGAMDVGNPANIARIIDLYGGNVANLRADVEGYAYSDEEIAQTMRDTYASTGMLIDPQGATALRALNRHLDPHDVGVALIGAHPAKFASAITAVTGIAVPIPNALRFPNHLRPRIHSIPPSLSALNHVLATL